MRFLLVLCTVFAGCIDFVEPDLPERGAPAVLVLTVRVMELGAVEVEGRLEPGLDAGGVPREVRDAHIRVLGRSVAPDSVGTQGTRVYRAAWTRDTSSAITAVEARGPEITGLVSTPVVRWHALRRSGPQSVELGPAADLPLRIELDPGAAEPEPEIRQWFLTVSDSARLFRLGSNGPPPSEILVPARWIPDGDSLGILLIYQQIAKIESPQTDYVGLVTLDVRVSWTARRAAAGPGGKEQE